MASLLVIDDDANNRLLLSTLAKHAGYEVIEAATGAGGLQAAIETAPEVIVVDLSLPDLSGTQVIRALRSHERTKAARVALYTATHVPAAIDEIADLYGIDEIIPKPGDPRDILAALKRLTGPDSRR